MPLKKTQKDSHRVTENTVPLVSITQLYKAENQMYGVVVQARMSSQRLPGKILRKVHDKSLLQYLLDSLSHCREVDQIIVATSVESSDDVVACFCQSNNITCHRGPLENVSLRFYQTLELFPFTAFVRISGDSPLLDYRLVDKALRLFKTGKYDLVTNVAKRTFPKGQSVEVISSCAFKKAFKHMTTNDELEHVTPYFYKNLSSEEIKNFESGGEYNHIPFAIDSDQDFQQFKKLISKLEQPHYLYTWEKLIKFWMDL